jgi:hypothetical protein|tara:strand:+ start:69 stop:227 length:159 start_codon:yes stop_codon:yes gene_type:complete
MKTINEELKKPKEEKNTDRLIRLYEFYLNLGYSKDDSIEKAYEENYNIERNK